MTALEPYIQHIITALFILFILILLLTEKSFRIRQFRWEILIAIEHNPEAKRIYSKRMPSFWKMFFSLKPVTMKNWVPADLRAAIEISKASPAAQKALKKYMENSLKTED